MNNANKKQKRKMIVIFTILGVIALFLTVVFIPVGNDVAPVLSDIDVGSVDVQEDEEIDSMSKSELEKRVKELEQENKDLLVEVEKYKILAEQTTKSIEAPTVGSAVKDFYSEEETNSSSSDDKFVDSSDYYDDDYKKYTSEDSDKKPTTDNKKPTADNKKPTSVDKEQTKPDKDIETSDTGI